MKLVRLWVGDKDYGEMTERAAAELVRQCHERYYPNEPIRIEPVTPQSEEKPAS